MSDTFNHELQAIDSYYTDRNFDYQDDASYQGEVTVWRDKPISEMTKDHCTNAINYIIRNNNFLSNYQNSAIESFKKRISQIDLEFNK